MKGVWETCRDSLSVRRQVVYYGLTVKNRNEGYHYSEKEYADVAVTMMKLARKNFLTSFDSKNYQKGDGKWIVSDIIHKDTGFMADTKKLFS